MFVRTAKAGFEGETGMRLDIGDAPSRVTAAKLRLRTGFGELET